MSLTRTEPVLIRHLVDANDNVSVTALRAFTRARSEVSCHGLGQAYADFQRAQRTAT